ncbi:class F sortase [Kitasatospora sp. NPDC058965]|uniref:class F sortase n=1 Tax=Kitasatospora sp. NPDC058965 TaxID=3346682 RepID=UPI0036A4FA44
MSDQPPAPDRRTPAPGGHLFRWAMGAVVLGLLVIHQSVDTSPAPLPGPPPAAAATPAGAQSPAPRAGAPAGNPGLVLPHSRPVRIRIPQLFVEAPFTTLDLDASGTLQAPPPDDRNLVGWYEHGPSPGERGAAVVAGHVDTRTGPAVFLMLHLLTPGSTVDITREDRTTATFTVDSVQNYSKSTFPDQQVYAATPDAELRLITCAGTYNQKTHDYTDNLVVFAHLTSQHPA